MFICELQNDCKSIVRLGDPVEISEENFTPIQMNTLKEYGLFVIHHDTGIFIVFENMESKKFYEYGLRDMILFQIKGRVPRHIPHLHTRN